ncbi:hypothetical protein E2C01_023426 [Portunus trituberculatus]|uniref:Uncharacterized protein n=1 Tax=Portunus trituberculatus TaxID=210409 RepID=A0A5B7E8S6_PORTR|nr:hypothetical protein [Portunus trituberculatus]
MTLSEIYKQHRELVTVVGVTRRNDSLRGQQGNARRIKATRSSGWASSSCLPAKHCQSDTHYRTTEVSASKQAWPHPS